jgi:hypothetical protein
MPNQNTPQITAKEQESNISVSTEKIEKQVEDLFEGVPKKNTPLEMQPKHQK